MNLASLPYSRLLHALNLHTNTNIHINEKRERDFFSREVNGFVNKAGLGKFRTPIKPTEEKSECMNVEWTQLQGFEPPPRARFSSSGSL